MQISFNHQVMKKNNTKFVFLVHTKAKVYEPHYWEI